MANFERVVARLEAAGGEMTGALERARQVGVDDALLARYTRVNRMIADLRRATVMLESGEPLVQAVEIADREVAT